MNHAVNQTSGTDSYQKAKAAEETRARLQKLKQKKRKKTKKLAYNHREVSALLLRAGRSQSAATVLTYAKGKLGTLKRCAASGEYNRSEVTNAISHAERMVRCAQLKVNNLKEEEKERRQKQRDSHTEKQQRKTKLKAKVRIKQRQLEQKLSAEQLKKLQEQKQEYENMERKRRMHRNEEHGKIMEADLKYFQGQGSHNSPSVCIPSTAVILELSQEKQYWNEQQIEQQVKREMSASGSEKSSDTQTASADVAVEGVDTAAAEASAAMASVDITI